MFYFQVSALIIYVILAENLRSQAATDMRTNTDTFENLEKNLIFKCKLRNDQIELKKLNY